jgi:exopolysaccharide biosynthesis polyprenyl glycosylphosphotransferase
MPSFTAVMLSIISFLLLVALSLSLIVRRAGAGPRVLVIGTSPLARQIVAEMSGCRRPRHRVTVAVEDPAAVHGPLSVVAIRPLERLSALIAELRPDRIVVALADRRGRLPVADLLHARVRGVVVEDAIDCYERLTGKIAIEALTPSTLIGSRGFRNTHADLAFGHIVSMALSLAALVILAPLLACIAVAIRLDSPGPVLFVHDRVGLGGRRMKLLKFRTMRPADGPTSEWAQDNGDRITRVGRWLRRYRLDELPQLINVLRGDLNLVGPRPHPASNFDLFSREIPYYALRAAVRPGLTGWAQVRQGYANGLQEETEKMRYDLYYIKHMSAWLDLRILFETIRIVVAGDARVREARAAKRRARTWRPSRVRLTAIRSTRA